jgi:hypothetical protein
VPCHWSVYIDEGLGSSQVGIYLFIYFKKLQVGIYWGIWELLRSVIVQG